MKSYFSIIIILFTIYSCNSKANKTKVITHNFGKFHFKEDAYDFGTVKEGDTATHVFQYKNTGRAPLIIKDVSTGCGCTAVQWTKKPVLPKDSGTVTVKFSKHHDPGLHTKLVIIKANTDYPYTVLKISATIK